MTSTIQPTNDNAVVGKGIYLEFVKTMPTMTTQILILPEGVTTSHKTVPMTMFSRRLTTFSPRRTWRQSSAYSTMSGKPISSVPTEELIDNALAFMRPIFYSLQTNDWSLYKQPVLVEVTREDLEHARNGKTPYKVLSRAWKVRKSLGFPAEYLHKPEEAAV